MQEKFKVRFTISVPKGKTKYNTYIREYIWDNEQDARDFKALLNKASDKSKFISAEVVKFAIEEEI